MEIINTSNKPAPYSIYPNSIGQIEQARIDFLNEQVQFWHNKYANLEKQIQDKIDELKEKSSKVDINVLELVAINQRIQVLEELLKGE